MNNKHYIVGGLTDFSRTTVALKRLVDTFCLKKKCFNYFAISIISVQSQTMVISQSIESTNMSTVNFTYDCFSCVGVEEAELPVDPCFLVK